MGADESGPAIAPGAYVAPEVRLGEHVSVAPGAVVLSSSPSGPPTVVEDGVDVGANATVLAGLTLGSGCVIRPGSVVTRSVPRHAIAEGNPALIVGYVDASSLGGRETSHGTALAKTSASRVEGVQLIDLHTARDLRGTLAVAEAGSDIPFEPLRTFLVYDVPTVETRGEHAHRQCQQVLVAVAGTLRVVVDDGEEREEFRLDRPSLALHVPAMTWGIQYGFSPDAVLMVLASHRYDPDDYIRDYDEFLAWRRSPAAGA